MSDHSPPNADQITLRYIFVPDGEPMPDIWREFRDPIMVRARFERDPALPAPDSPPDRAPDALATLDQAGDDVADLDVADLDDVPLLVLSATGAVLAQGTAATVSAQAMRLARVMPKYNPYFLAAAGGVLAFATLAALMEHLAQMSGDRNAGLPSGVRARSQRARARAADRAAADPLRNEEWSVHHLVGIGPAKDHLALLTAATRAGWRMDEAENVMILPRTAVAQAKLAAAGIRRPVHDNGHPEWNQDVHLRLLAIERQLRRYNYSVESSEYTLLAQQALRRLQTDLRRDAKTMKRIAENDVPDGSPSASSARIGFRT